ncbi:MAG: arsenate reductase ArsC, partial [Bacteroidota bacterium]
RRLAYTNSCISMKRVLIICTGNSARSQIAEGLFRHLGGADFNVHSAGTRPAGLIHPLAVDTMRERGIDISNQTSKSLSIYDGQRFDYVITVCDEAHQVCPFFSGAKIQLHWSTPDPSFVSGNDEERREAFRRTIALLEERVSNLIAEIKNTKAASS